MKRYREWGNRKGRREKEKKEERGKRKREDDIPLGGEQEKEKEENEGCFIFGSDSIFYFFVDLWWFYVDLQ